MNSELIQRFIGEIIEDYENYGKDKDEKEWLIEAIKRHIIDVTDEEAQKIAQELISGVELYREAKEKGEIIKEIELKDKAIKEEIELMADSVVEDFYKASKSQSEGVSDGKE